MYKILGSDQKEYGPISGDQMREWIAQRRANGQTQVLPEGATQWQPLSTLPEFSAALATVAPALPIPGAFSGGPAPVAPKTSGMAVTSLVVGILGACTFGIGSIIGLILGLVSLNKIKKSNGQLGGKGLAIAGVCVSVAVIPITAILAGLLLPALANAKGKAQTINCVNNLKQIALAARIYANDHNDTFPPTSTWCDALQTELGNSSKVLHCNADTTGQRSTYGYNLQLSGKKDGDVNPRTVMFFEIDGGWNVSGGPELLPQKPRHRQIVNIAFADGSVQQVRVSDLSQLRWNP